MARRTSLLMAVITVLVLVSGPACSNREPRQARAPQTGTATAKVAADGVQEITVVGNQQFRFVPSTVRAKPGPLRIVLTTSGGTPHDLLLERVAADGSGPNTGLVGAGERRQITVDLKPGRYPFICTLHTRLHMVGTVVVS